MDTILVITSMFFACITLLLFVYGTTHVLHTISHYQLVKYGEFKRVITETAMPYFTSLNRFDLYTRNAATPSEYLEKYLNSFVEFTTAQKSILWDLFRKADLHLRKKFPLLHAIPWRVAKINRDVENGYPHTHGDIILLSDTFFQKSKQYQVKTLIHEKVHVLQRLYPLWAKRIISQWGFITYDKDSFDMHNAIPLRNNPDLSGLYGTEKGIMAQVFASLPPTSLADSFAAIIDNETWEVHYVTHAELGIPSYVHQLEHPYEIMACMVPELVFMEKEESAMMQSEKILMNAMLFSVKNAL